MTKITKLHVYDFDGTLVLSPLPEFGKPKWEEFHGKEFPHVGWWSKLESLDTDIFEMRVLPQVADFYNESYTQEDTMNIMLTGRRGGKKNEALMAAVRAILDSRGLIFDSYHFNYRGETSEFKIGELERILSENPDIVEVTLYDDRLSHEEGFRVWGNTLLDNGRLEKFTFNLITSDHHDED
jgi:hypothetical protein